jgi:hypothetical protein
MNKEQKINYVFFWLQCFGERDNETFGKELTVNGKRWSIWRQFDYDSDGDMIVPYNGVSWSNKLVRDRSIDGIVDGLTEEELDLLIEALKEHQTHW